MQSRNHSRGKTTKAWTITVITQFPIQSQSPTHRAEGNKRQKEKWRRGESHFNECFNLAAVPVQRRAPYQRWMASPLRFSSFTRSSSSPSAPPLLLWALQRGATVVLSIIYDPENRRFCFPILTPLKKTSAHFLFPTPFNKDWLILLSCLMFSNSDSTSHRHFIYILCVLLWLCLPFVSFSLFRPLSFIPLLSFHYSFSEWHGIQGQLLPQM